MSIPLLLEPEQLLPLLGDDSLLIVDCSSESNYQAGHIPDAVHLPAGQLQCGVKPASGKLPDKPALERLFGNLGLRADSHVIAVDDEGGGWAGRLIWTLDCIGHRHYSLLNGGMIAWTREGFPLQQQAAVPAAARFHIEAIDQRPIASLEQVTAALSDPGNHAIWDARSPEEYQGTKVLARHGGHIPGAANLEWTALMDRSNNLRLLPREQMQAMIESLGLTPDKTIITHCQSHHRSGLTYFIAKLLGYPEVKAYDGSWGEWGNRDDTPIDSV